MLRPRREHAPLAAVLTTALVCCCAPAWARAAAPPVTGGAGIPQEVPQASGGAGYGDPGKRSVVVAATALVGDVVAVRGTIPKAARRRIVLQRFDHRHGWRDVRRSRVHGTSRFLVRWRADRSGRIGLRVVLVRRKRPETVAPVARIDVYRPAKATFFGPGLYGQRTYCHQTLTPLLLGVANRTLPCGTEVAILYDRRQIVVPVVDRGPFNAGYDWDLTQATADALGFAESGPIGYVRIEAAAG
jgi:hypothetical protein